MANIGHLHTYKEAHSIKEAVISFTVTPQIQNPGEYQKLLADGKPLASIYQRFEPVKTVEVQMNMNALGPQYNVKHDSGFKMIGFKNGSATDVIQGLNQPNVGIFTFNTVNYIGWQNFYSQAIDSATRIVEFNPNYQVRSFNVLFIDEFYFVENAYQPDELFRRGSKNLPEGIFDSSVIDYNLVMQREKEKKYYQEEMSIKVFDETGKKTIRIIGICSIYDERVEEPFLVSSNPFMFMTSTVTSLKNRVSEIGMLKSNWDGYNAIVPSYRVVNNAFRFLDTLSMFGFADILDPENVVPTPYGTIDMDFETSNGLVSVEIGTSQVGFFTEFLNDEDTLSDGIDTDFKEIPQSLMDALFILKETSKRNAISA